MSKGSSVKQSFEQRAKRQGIRIVDPAVDVEEEYFKRFRNLDFWLPNKQEHEDRFNLVANKKLGIDKVGCCFWHAVGLPEKNGEPKGCFDYEQEIFDAIAEHRYVWIKKATGLGITELMIRLIAWLCLKDDEFKGTQVCIVTGPRIELSITIIQRIKALFPEMKFESKETVVELNGVKIEAFPSHHLDAMRGLPDVSLIFLDEADFFPPGEQKSARDVSERYIGKSDPYIIMVSTPNAPEGLFEQIENEADDLCLYHRIKLNYEAGLHKIYTDEEITKARESPSFEREYNLKYIGQVGNVFSQRSIQTAIDLGGRLEAARKGGIPYDMVKSMGVDAGFGSSKFGICVTGLNRHGIVEVLYAEEFDRPDFNEMIDEIIAVRRNFNVSKCYIDDMNPEVVSALKAAYGEDPDYRTVMSKHKHDSWMQWMSILPISFRSEHKGMLAHTKRFLDAESLAISPTKFSKLIVALRTAVASESTLNKELSSHDDIIDALRLSLKHFAIQTEKEKVVA